MCRKVELIYCAAGNRQWAQEFIDAGYSYGARLPEKVYFKPVFVDQDYENPDRAAYMAALAAMRPRLATVLDWQSDDQTLEVSNWIIEALPYVSEALIVIPKWSGAIPLLSRWFPDRTFFGKQIRLGYSVPTAYGKTLLPVESFKGWPVHLLGGSVTKQVELARVLDVWSADQNYMHHKIKNGQFFDGQRWRQLRDVGCNVRGAAMAKEVITRSVPNIRAMWAALT